MNMIFTKEKSIIKHTYLINFGARKLRSLFKIQTAMN